MSCRTTASYVKLNNILRNLSYGILRDQRMYIVKLAVIGLLGRVQVMLYWEILALHKSLTLLHPIVFQMHNFTSSSSHHLARI